MDLTRECVPFHCWLISNRPEKSHFILFNRRIAFELKLHWFCVLVFFNFINYLFPFICVLRQYLMNVVGNWSVNNKNVCIKSNIKRSSKMKINFHLQKYQFSTFHSKWKWNNLKWTKMLQFHKTILKTFVFVPIFFLSCHPAFCSFLPRNHFIYSCKLHYSIVILKIIK